MIAGPNGAGKTTTATALIPNLTMLYDFINADEIARGLAPLNPESVALTASKLMIKRLRSLLEARKNFAFETTASGTNYVKHLQEAKSQGYEINLIYLWLSSPDHAVKRVAQRVMQGGHYVAEEIIRRRYYGGLKNLLKYYLPLADSVIILDNSLEKSNRIIARKNIGHPLEIEETSLWEEMHRIAYE